MKIEHTFPVDGEYVIKLRLWRNTFDLMRGMEDPHDIEIAMDGARLTVVTAGGRDDFGRMAENPGTFGADLDRRLTVRLPVKAGTHTIWATTVLKSQAPRDDLIKPFIRTTIDGLDIMGDPSVDRITIEGPYAASGPGDTASRRKILQCTPTARRAGDRRARSDILTTLARQAYRKPVDGATARRADGLLRARAKERCATSIAASSRRCSSSSRARSSCSASSPIRHRACAAAATSPPDRSIASAISSWRRGSRSSCGAASRTSRWSRSPRREN